MFTADHFLDFLPIWAIFILFVVSGLLVYESGFRIGRWYQHRTPDEKEGPTGMLVGSLLGLLALLLAFSVGMATDRFDARRSLVLKESNAVGTTYLRAGYLPAPYDVDIRNLLREYVPLQIFTTDRETMETNLARSEEIQGEVWAQAEDLARQSSSSEMVALFIESLNETIDLHTERVNASIYARVPDTVLYILVLGGVLTVGMVGYNAGLSNKRSTVGAIILIVVLAAVITLVMDLDRPRDGFLIVSQRPFEELQADIGAPQE
jgi:hypothetical protein